MTVITWYEATAFCAWLSAELADALPSGHVIRLPTEAEWEAAAAFAAPGQKKRDYPWDEGEATPDRAVYDAWKLNAAAPVGLCPAGAAACGALDMAGNVWEWCSSSYKAYPAGAYQFQKDFTNTDIDVPNRGHAYYGDSTDVRCGARGRLRPGYYFLRLGVRVVVAPELAHMS